MPQKTLARAVGSSSTNTMSPACVTNKQEDNSSPLVSLPQDITHVGLSGNSIIIQEFPGNFSGSEHTAPGFGTRNALQLVL